MRSLILVLLYLICVMPGSAQERGLRPDFVTTQYAGSIGFVSVGAGYNIFKDKARASLQYGYVPHSKGGVLNILSAKMLFRTGTISLSRRTTFEPFAGGVMASYHFGKEFRSRWPGQRYPDGYYWWRTSLKVHLNAQTSLTYKLNSERLESVSVFVDLNVNELYLVSYVPNMRSLSIADIVKIGYGMRLNF